MRMAMSHETRKRCVTIKRSPTFIIHGATLPTTEPFPAEGTHTFLCTVEAIGAMKNISKRNCTEPPSRPRDLLFLLQVRACCFAARRASLLERLAVGRDERGRGWVQRTRRGFGQGRRGSGGWSNPPRPPPLSIHPATELAGAARNSRRRGSGAEAVVTRGGGIEAGDVVGIEGKVG